MVAERFESALWQTSSLLLAANREAILIDPCISVAEVGLIAARVRELGLRVTHVLATHADWDHVCGIAAFPEALSTTGEATAERIRSGEPAASLAQRAVDHGLELAGEPRVDRTFVPGTAVSVGPFLLETLALPGHTPDGTAYRIRDLDLLAVGDHLSTIEFPFASSTADYRATLAALIDLLNRDPPARVVPGHGPELTAADARAVAEADLAYLWALHTAVAGAARSEEARERALAVPVPRAGADGLDAARAGNADAAVAEIFGAV